MDAMPFRAAVLPLGAFLDAVSCGLRCLPDVHLDCKPRMADFAMWGVAVESACPWPAGTFTDAYTGNRQGTVEATLDDGSREWADLYRPGIKAPGMRPLVGLMPRFLCLLCHPGRRFS